ncbi:hypothetical protein M5689_018832 [Euphorbia peplus]|nr:hypothetical protein M5689_018832 [Euphorbia peplus]
MSHDNENENENENEESSFHKFYERFLHRQKQLCHDLISASKTHQNDVDLQRHVNRVIEHYEQYYHSKSLSAKHHVLPMFSPSWTTSLESAFLWIAGWRPSIAFHLLYSQAGLQLEAQFHDIISGLRNGDLGDLSPTQLSEIDAFQRQVIKEERDVTEELAKHQETVADSSMVELSNAVSDMIRFDSDSDSNSNSNSNSETEMMEKRVESALAPKEQGLEEILEKADELRLTTLKGIVNILNPLQGVHFLIALAQLHLRFHEWGNKKDHNNNNNLN